MNKINKSSKIYTGIAPFYDSLMNDDKYKKWQKLITNTVKKYHIPTEQAIDIACGTGRTSKMLYDLGFEVIGVDYSKEMLKCAKLKYPFLNFIRKDMRKLSFPKKNRFNFAISFYDSINYLTKDKDVLDMFNAVASCLKPSGIFLFDINTKEHIRVAQHFNPQVVDSKGGLIILRHGGSKNLWKIDIDVFVKKNKNLFVRIKEYHIERGYSQLEIKNILKKTNLKLLDVKKDIGHDNRDRKYPSRLYFVVRLDEPLQLKRR